MPATEYPYGYRTARPLLTRMSGMATAPESLTHVDAHQLALDFTRESLVRDLEKVVNASEIGVEPQHLGNHRHHSRALYLLLSFNPFSD